VRPGQNPHTYVAAMNGVLDADEVFGVLSEKARKIAAPAKR
jgi:hypothetical protein